MIQQNVNDCVDIFIDKLNRAMNLSTSIKFLNSKSKHLKEQMMNGLLWSLRYKQDLSSKVKKLPNNSKLLSYYIIHENK